MRIILALALLFGIWTEAVAQQAGNYVLRAGDTIEVSVWNDPGLNRKLMIAPDGMISFPLAGYIRAAGLTIPALEKELTNRLRKNYKTDPKLSVTLADVGEGTASASSEIFITGEVNKPGNYAITPGMNIMQAIALSGGLGKFASKSKIQIHRRVHGTEQVFLFNYGDFESGKNLAGNIVVQPGDVIVVPERGLFN